MGLGFPIPENSPFTEPEQPPPMESPQPVGPPRYMEPPTGWQQPMRSPESMGPPHYMRPLMGQQQRIGSPESMPMGQSMGPSPSMGSPYLSMVYYYYLLLFVRASEGTLSTWSWLHLQSLAPTQVSRRVDVKQMAGRKNNCRIFITTG
jgi:hypothetical protein